jgi:hypothetical protein
VRAGPVQGPCIQKPSGIEAGNSHVRIAGKNCDGVGKANAVVVVRDAVDDHRALDGDPELLAGVAV